VSRVGENNEQGRNPGKPVHEDPPVLIAVSLA